MATSGDGSLSHLAIEDLSEKIAVKDMISIAIKYLGVDYEEIDNLKTKRRDDITWINRDLLRAWRRTNQSDNQVQVSDIYFDVIEFSKVLMPKNFQRIYCRNILYF